MKYVFLAAFSLFLSYSSYWAPYYVSLFSTKDQLTILGDVEKFLKPCKEPDSNKATCRAEYHIPLSFSQREKEHMSIGMGTILFASEYFCPENPNEKIIFDDINDPGRLHETINIYQTHSFSRLNCSKKIIVRAWSKKNTRRAGHTGGIIVIGDSTRISQIKNLSEFFNNKFRYILAFSVLVAFLITIYVETISPKKLNRNLFERSYFSWTMFSIIGSGIAATLLPISTPLIFRKISGVFSMIAHFDPVNHTLSSDKKSPKLITQVFSSLNRRPFNQFPVSFFHLFVIAICFSPYFVKIFAPLALCYALVFIIYSAKAKEVLPLMYGILVAVNSLTMFGVYGMPHSHLASIYVTFVLIDSAIKKIIASGKINEIINFSRKISKDTECEKKLEKMLGDLSINLGCKRITVIELIKDSECLISIYQKEKNKTTFRELTKYDIPPVFAHVITTKKPIWHLHQDSQMGVSIKKSANKKADIHGDIFSVVPLSTDDYVIGAIAFTDYSPNIANSSSAQEELETLIDIVKPYIVNILSKRKLDRDTKEKDRRLGISEDINSIRSRIVSSSQNEKELLHKSLSAICNRIGTSGFIGKIEQESREISVQSIYGYTKDIEKKFKQNKFFAYSKNLQGPLPLAVNRKETIIVSDLKLIKSVILKHSYEILQESKANSCACIPIILEKNENNTLFESETIVWGVLWLQVEAPFSLGIKDKPLLDLLGRLISDTVESLEKNKKYMNTIDALEEFVPQHIASKIINNEEAVEEEDGYLIMIDLKNSTGIAEKIGSDGWKAFVQKLTPEIRTIFNQEGIKIQKTVWDAFYLTTKKDAPDKIYSEKVTRLCFKALEIINFQYQSELGIKTESEHQARICIVHGDISRGMSVGENANWTIIGKSMAKVSKLEQECKSLDGAIFITESMVDTIPNKFIISDTSRILETTQEKIYSIHSKSEELEIKKSA